MSQAKLDELLKDVEETPIEDVARGSGFGDITRAAAQGLTFGFADEIEAAVRSAFDSGKTYAEVVKDVRGQIDSFRQRNPATAFSAEIAGAILPTIAAQFVPGGQAALASTGARISQGVRALGGGQKATRTAQVAAASGGQSALYGAGSAEGGLAERLPSAAASGVIGTVAGPVIERVAPVVTSKAADLIKRGVPVTPGQAVRESGLLGRGLARLEEGVADNVFLIGDAVRGAFDRANTGFNRAAVTEALAPAGIKVKKGLEGKQLIGFGQKALSTQYDRTLSKMSIPDVLPVASALDTITKDLSDDIAADVQGRVQRYIIKQFKGGEMTGANIKKAQTFLRRDITRLRKEGSEIAARKADALEDIRSVFSAELQKTNPVLAPQLSNIDKAYGQFEIVRNAELRRKTGEGFLPGDLLQAAAKGDATKRQSKFSAGEARMQRLAQDAQDVIGNTTPNSGTAGRQQAARIVTGQGGLMGATQVEPTTAGLALIAPAAYSPVGVPVARNIVSGAGRAMQAAVPVAAANTTEMTRQMLADLLRR